MEILHYLDVAIGFTLAMMVLATLIGTTSAMWLAAFQSKVRNLQNGLQEVLGSLGGALDKTEQLNIVKSLLRGRMTASWSPVRWLGFGATEAVGREEFVILLLRAGVTAPGSKLGAAIQGITNQPPETTLRAVEKAILDQEIANPSAPANVWRTHALKEAAPALAARLFAQFDDVLARVDDNTAYSRKLLSGVLALVFFVIFPVNSFDVLSRLTNDKALAASIAKIAEAENAKAITPAVPKPDPVKPENSGAANGKAAPPAVPKPDPADLAKPGAASIAKTAAAENDKAVPPLVPTPDPAESETASAESNPKSGSAGNDKPGPSTTATPAPAEICADALCKAIDKQGLFGDVFSDTGAHMKLIKETRRKDGLSGAAKVAIKESLSEPGVWTTFILVSLGAPFWQALLDKLLGLRSKITKKTEEERAQRAAQNPTTA